ncbi:MAG TPA: hypothetical protein VMB21_20640 [Candidatus Limnocylindria bacterium]|jgi:hypothetical protein|nr:hypothetical protein [Candidatus Limnocylindria bacterium]
MPDTSLSSRLLAETDNYDAAANARDLLSPYREFLLRARAKYMSYEQIAATLAKHGIRISPTAVGVFCRRHFTRAEIERVRAGLVHPPVAAASTLPGLNVPPAAPAPSPTPAPDTGRRGPKIARDDF